VQKTITVTVRDLQPGDYVVPAKATVLAVDRFAGLAIVDFTDKTATAPLPQRVPVQIIRTVN
jgi:hypothetical protein